MVLNSRRVNRKRGFLVILLVLHAASTKPIQLNRPLNDRKIQIPWLIYSLIKGYIDALIYFLMVSAIATPYAGHQCEVHKSE